ncbi:hypothetical protein ACFL08_02150 [Patescibacteria group bacterium]
MNNKKGDKRKTDKKDQKILDFVKMLQEKKKSQSLDSDVTGQIK